MKLYMRIFGTPELVHISKEEGIPIGRPGVEDLRSVNPA